jgi:hypothetical protein
MSIPDLDPRWVKIPAASYARTSIVRPEPAGTVIVPDAVPFASVKLNTRGEAMSLALTSTTTVAIGVPATLAETMRRPGSRFGRGGSIPDWQAAAAKVTSSPASTVRRKPRSPVTMLHLLGSSGAARSGAGVHDTLVPLAAQHRLGSILEKAAEGD